MEVNHLLEAETRKPLFDIEKSIGKGSIGEVFRVTSRKDRKTYAVKLIEFQFGSTTFEEVLKEVNFMRGIDHPNIVKCIDAFLTEYSNEALRFGIQMEYCQLGDLDTFIQNRNGRKFRSQTIHKWMLELSSALRYVHSKRIMHRDVHLGNILLDEFTNIKIGDFGLAKDVRYGFAATNIGSTLFAAPETMTGCITYGHKKISIIRKCIASKKEERPTADQIFQDLQTDDYENLCFSEVRSPNTLSSINNMVSSRKPDVLESAFVFSNRPLKPGEAFSVIFQNVRNEGPSEVIFGLTATNPRTLLDKVPSTTKELRTCSESFIQVEKLLVATGSTFTFWFTNGGQIMFDYNGKLGKCSNTIPTSTNLWAFFNIHGEILQVQLQGHIPMKAKPSSGEIFEMTVENKVKKTMEDPQGLETGSGQFLFEIEGRIGKGGFGEVLKVKTKKDNKTYALKMIELKGKFITFEAVLKEISFMQGIDHPNIVKFIDAFQTEQRSDALCFGIQMEYCALGDMDTFIYKRNGRKFRSQTIHKWMTELSGAIGYIHSKSIMHRDLKPGNVFLDQFTNIKIGDFGIARDVLHSLAGTKIGTSVFMAPETFTGRYYIEADVYSLGCVFVCMVALCRIPKQPNGQFVLLPPTLTYGKNKMSIINRCISAKKDERPTASEIYQLLQKDDYEMLSLNEVRSANTLSSVNKMVAGRKPESTDSGFVFSSRPLNADEPFSLVIQKARNCIPSRVMFGFTSTDPKSFSGQVPSTSVELESTTRSFIQVETLPVAPGNSLTFWFTAAGQIVFDYNGKRQTSLNCVDASSNLWAFFNIHAEIIQVQLKDYDCSTFISPK